MPSPDSMAIVGYPDRISVAPGESIGFCVSCEDGVGTYVSELVRLYQADPDPRGPGVREERIDAVAANEHPARRQEIRTGSHILVADHPELELESLSVQAMVWPTRPTAGRQGIVTKWSAARGAGYALVLDEHGCVALLLGDGHGGVEQIGTGVPLLERCWYLAAATVDTSGAVTVHQAPVVSSVNSPVSPLVPLAEMGATVRRSTEVAPVSSGGPLVVAGWVEDGEAVTGHFNGKIERPRLARRALSLGEVSAFADDPAIDGAVAAWDFSRELTPDGVQPFARISDVLPGGHHGETVNSPARAMTGHNWSGRHFHFASAPEEYGAIHFHEDDLDDARWEVDFTLELPAGLASGVYAAKLTGGGDEDYVPFYLRPPRGGATAKVGFLVPTNSYLAYANDNVAVDDELQELATGRVAILSRQALHLNAHREYGGSLYDLHSDGSGTCYSSWRRPVLTMRPKCRHTYARVWQFSADLHLVDWLDQKGIEVDLFTDEDLYLEGAALLERYNVVLTGSHPEYTSVEMLDAIEAYLGNGGRLMYLGGNGFYWVVSFHPDKPHMIEVRRWGGTGNWMANPGESHTSFTGEMGGIWRNRGRPPQKLVGVGFVAQGLDRSAPYRRKPDSFDPRASWIFEGVGDEELVGDFGLAGDGASGLEVDWYDPSLGSPPHGFLLASSEGHTSVVTEVRENFGGTLANPGGDENPHVRNDLVYFTTPSGGAVFSTGSIAWCASLSHNGYDNNVSRVTENVLRRFAIDGPVADG
jgi:N,N-dimethylformamidase beta subunit-like, C-terminal